MDLMIDIETMSIHTHNALVLSVATVGFELTPAAPLIGASKLWVLDPREQFALGREVTASTTKWWSEQSDAARYHWLNGATTPLIDALLEITDAYKECSGGIWANGVCFDINNIDQLYASMNQPVPWKFNKVRDSRTIRGELPVLRKRPDSANEGADHNPIVDCVKQIWDLWERWPFP